MPHGINLAPNRNYQAINDEYKDAIKKHVDTEKIAAKHFHVVVDAANSVGGIALPPLLGELGCKVTTINANIDGTFPGRLPEPRPESLGDLSATVKAVGADMGVAFDGDADRSIFCGRQRHHLLGRQNLRGSHQTVPDQESRRKNRYTRELIHTNQRHCGSLQGRTYLDQSRKRNRFADNESRKRQLRRGRKRRQYFTVHTKRSAMAP